MPKKTIILGIDPGLADTGFGIIEKQGASLSALDFGSVKTDSANDTETRLLEIYQNLNQLIKKYKPQKVAIEKLFFAKNIKTALDVGQSRGVAILAAGNNKLKIAEFTPLQVKQAITSYGKADKKQVQQMVKIILNLKNPPKSDDAADALAVAICYANYLSASLPEKK